MDYMAFAKKYALQIAVAIVLLIVASIIYDRFLSDKAKFIGYLKDQIEEKDQEIGEIQKEYKKLSEEEQKRLQEIAALKSQVADLRKQIIAGEVSIDAIKNDIIEIDEAIAIIEENTRGTVARSRSVLTEDRSQPKPN